MSDCEPSLGCCGVLLQTSIFRRPCRCHAGLVSGCRIWRVLAWANYSITNQGSDRNLWKWRQAVSQGISNGAASKSNEQDRKSACALPWRTSTSGCRMHKAMVQQRGLRLKYSDTSRPNHARPNRTVATSPAILRSQPHSEWLSACAIKCTCWLEMHSAMPIVFVRAALHMDEPWIWWVVGFRRSAGSVRYLIVDAQWKKYK